MEGKTLTSKLGRFEFDSGVKFWVMKEIRDSVTGQYFAPKSDGIRIRTVQDAQTFVLNHMSRNVAETPFELVIASTERR